MGFHFSDDRDFRNLADKVTLISLGVLIFLVGFFMLYFIIKFWTIGG